MVTAISWMQEVGALMVEGTREMMDKEMVWNMMFPLLLINLCGFKYCYASLSLSIYLSVYSGGVIFKARWISVRERKR